jgi:hypothetical protein
MSGAHGLDLPEGTPPWLTAFVAEAQRETDTLRENGADQAASARLALLRKLVAAAAAYLDAEIDVHEAARDQDVCEETIRRAVRDGRIPDRRANPKGRHRVRRGDLNRVAGPPAGRMIPLPMPRASPNSGGSYDPEVQAVLVQVHR